MFNRVVQIIKLVFSRTPDTSTHAGRSQDRYRRAGRTAVTSVAARIVNYLGPDRFGLWMVLTSFVAFLTFTDMGLGIGLQNALSECHGREDRDTPKALVSSAVLVMGLIFLLLVLVAIFVLPLLPLDRLIKMDTEAARAELLPTAQVIMIAFGFGLPTGLIQRIYNAYQMGYWGDMWLTAGRVAGFLGVLACIWLKLSLPFLVGAYTGVPFVVLGLGSVFLFRKISWVRPSLVAISRKATRKIFGIGATAVGAQVAYVILLSGPAIVIANRLSTTAVAPFAVTQKLLGLTSILLTTLLLPLWPAYGEAAARGDWGWVKKTFRRTIKLGVAIYLPAFLLMAFAGRTIIYYWTQDESVIPAWSLLMACNVWSVLMAWNVIAAMLLNGLNHMIGQATYGVALALAAVAVGYLVAPSYGVIGVIWVAVLLGAALRSVAMGLEVAWTMKKRMRSSNTSLPAAE